MSAEKTSEKETNFHEVLQKLKAECPDCFFSTQFSQACHTSAKDEDSQQMVQKCETIQKIYKQCPKSNPELVHSETEVTERPFEASGMHHGLEPEMHRWFRVPMFRLGSFSDFERDEQEQLERQYQQRQQQEPEVVENDEPINNDDNAPEARDFRDTFDYFGRHMLNLRRNHGLDALHEFDRVHQEFADFVERATRRAEGFKPSQEKTGDRPAEKWLVNKI